MGTDWDTYSMAAGESRNSLNDATRNHRFICCCLTVDLSETVSTVSITPDQLWLPVIRATVYPMTGIMGHEISPVQWKWWRRRGRARRLAYCRGRGDSLSLTRYMRVKMPREDITHEISFTTMRYCVYGCFIQSTSSMMPIKNAVDSVSLVLAIASLLFIVVPLGATLTCCATRSLSSLDYRYCYCHSISLSLSPPSHSFFLC